MILDLSNELRRPAKNGRNELRQVLNGFGCYNLNSAELITDYKMK